VELPLGQYRAKLQLKLLILVAEGVTTKSESFVAPSGAKRGAS